MKRIGRIIAWICLGLSALICWAWVDTYDTMKTTAGGTESLELVIGAFGGSCYIALSKPFFVRVNRIWFIPPSNHGSIDFALFTVSDRHFAFHISTDPSFFLEIAAPCWFFLLTLMQWPMFHFGLAWWAKRKRAGASS